MSYWYLRTIKDAWVLNESTTNRLDLPTKGHLSGLLIKLYVLSEQTLQSYDNTWPSQRSTLQVVGNGNFPIINVKANHLQAINFWNKGEMPEDVLQTGDAHWTEQYIYIPFGRHIGDELLGLVLENFGAGVQLVETNTFDTDYYTDENCKMDVYGLFRKSPEPDLFSGGFLRKRQVFLADTASRTENDVKMPTENLIRQIYTFSEPDLSSHVPATTVFTNFQKVFLSILSKDEFILNNVAVSAWARFIHDYIGRRAVTSLYGNNTSGGTYFDTMIYERLNSILTCVHTTNLNVVEYALTIMERIARVYGYDADAGTASNVNFMGTFHGICYNGLIPLLMTNPLAAPEDWLNADEKGDVTVGMTEGASTGNIYGVLDELETVYP